MKVFNTCWIIIKRHIGAFALYFGIFIALAVIMTAMSVTQHSTGFTATRPNFTVISRDGGSPIVDGLKAYLAAHGDEVPLPDEKEALQDAAFFHATDYIAILPQGFHDAIQNGQPAAVQTATIEESAKGYYADSLLGQYLNLVRVYRAANPGMDEGALVAAVLRDLSAETAVEMKRFGTGTPVSESVEAYVRMMCYILIVLIVLCVSNILMAFRRPDVRMRNLCAPVSPRAVGIQQILCNVLVGALAWALLLIVGFVIYGKGLAGTDGRLIGLIVLNTFTVMLVALALATLASSFIRNANAQSAAANLLSLALCFLGGVFVPLELMGSGMLAIARFTPTYWYSVALSHICRLTDFDAGSLAPVWQAILIQLGFAAALLCVSLVVVKQQSQSERFFSSLSTELEA